MSQPLRERARVICILCHDRKVKCDLQSSADETCSNCRRSNQHCIRRDGLRRKRKAARRQDRDLAEIPSMTLDFGGDPGRAILSPAASTPRDSQWTPVPDVDKPDASFIADHSELSYESLSQAGVPVATIPRAMEIIEPIYGTPEAFILPKQPLLQALIDSYFENLFHYYPVVDRHDLIGPQASKLLFQSICLAGSLMRQMNDPNEFKLSQSIYNKVKTLIHTNHEQDSLAMLKAMCLIPTWSPNPPNHITLDGPWHWTGAATRLALQMGLHKESTYVNKADAGCRRRIWWQLYISDKLQAACWGRPVSLQLKDIDVRLPTLDDFQTRDIQARIFIYSTNLHIIIGKIAEFSSQSPPILPEDLCELITMLQDWLRSLPEDLRLYDSAGIRRPYYRPVCEIHIMYFAAIILVQSMHKQIDKHRRTSLHSVIASSCIASLYEEIYYRQHAHFLLHIHGFFIIVAAVSQIYYRPRTPEKVELRKQELDGLYSILRQMRNKYGGADMVLNKIAWLQTEVEKARQPIWQTPNRQTCETMCLDVRLLTTKAFENFSSSPRASARIWTCWISAQTIITELHSWIGFPGERRCLRGRLTKRPLLWTCLGWILIHSIRHIVELALLVDRQVETR